MNGNSRWFKAGAALMMLALGALNAWQFRESLPRATASDLAIEVGQAWMHAYDDCREDVRKIATRIVECRERLDDCLGSR